MRPKRFSSPCPPCGPPILWKVVSAGLVLLGCLAGGLQPGRVQAEERAEPQFVDLSLLVAPEFPCSWPGAGPGFQINHYRRIGPLSAYNSDVLTLDENVGTQFDGPTHSVAPPDSGKPNAGPYGLVTGDKVPAWQFVGEACVMDLRELLDTAPNGHSSLVEASHVQAWNSGTGPWELVTWCSSAAVTATATTVPSPRAVDSLPIPWRAGRRVGPIPLPIAWNTWRPER